MIERVAPLRLQSIRTPEGESQRASVFCPYSERTLDAGACNGCGRMKSVAWNPESGGEVTCIVGAEPEAPDPRADFRESAARAKVHEVLARSSTCVTPDLPIRELRPIFAASRVRAVAVVDDANRLLGWVARADLDGAAETDLAADRMTRCVPTLAEDAPVAHAVALMAFEGVSHVPVVTVEGKVVGMCDALDVMRWVAGELGYERGSNDGSTPVRANSAKRSSP